MNDTLTDSTRKLVDSYAKEATRTRRYERSRTVQGLVWSEYLSFSPFGKRRRLSSIQREGIRYENKFGKWLKRQVPPNLATLDHERWIEFEDDNGSGYACPDWVLHTPKRVYVFENKLTWHQYAYEQPAGLYAPLLADLEAREVVPILVYKNPGDVRAWLANRGSNPTPVNSLAEVYELPPGFIGFWHWIPR